MSATDCSATELIVLAIVAALLRQTVMIENFTIPTTAAPRRNAYGLKHCGVAVFLFEIQLIFHPVKPKLKRHYG